MRWPTCDWVGQDSVCGGGSGIGRGGGRGWLRKAAEASRRQLSLSDVPAHAFAVCQWQLRPRINRFYLLYRVAVLATTAGVAAASFACQELVYPADWVGPRVSLVRGKWFIYLTNWGFLLIVLQAALALAAMHAYVSRPHLPISEEHGDEDAQPPTPRLCRLYWVTHTVAVDLALVITLVYWTVVHDPKMNRLSALNVLVHGGNSLLMALETGLVSFPARPLHALYTVLFGLLYSLFSLLYFACGGTDRAGLPYIYKPLDWRSPADALVFIAMCAVAMCAAHALQYALSCARTRLATPRLPRLHRPHRPCALVLE